ncbi:MAG: DUF2130 domain-containing protein [Candidatus Binatus sp.]|jgi:hypothetical protein
MQNAIATVPHPASETCPWCGSEISHQKFLQVQTKIREEERKRLAQVRAEIERESGEKIRLAKAAATKEANEQAAKSLAALKTERDAATARLKQIQQATEEAKKAVAAELERKHQAELLKQREILAKDRDSAVLKARADFNREREGLQKKVGDMERQLQQKTANQIGDGAEINLYDALRDGFPNDKITRIKKGTPGADIVHEVLHKGQSCGQIIIDSKNRQAWHDTYVTKLRADQVEAGADHAVLATSVFPSGTKELHLKSGVIIVSPARVVQVIEILRSFMVKLHVLGLSNSARMEKTAELYKFITSDVYAQKMKEAARLTGEILDVDVEETKAHQKVWEKRGRLARGVQRSLRELESEVSAIIERQ